MNYLRSSGRIAFIVAFLFTCCFASQSQTRTFVSGLGTDANACTRNAPCRTFQKAHDVAASGGEVVALDSAGYGQITITKSVSIIGDGVYAGISASSGNAITIASAGITVALRSLTIDGLGTATNGILATDFTVLHIENCNVNGFTHHAIWFADFSPHGPGRRKVFIKDSIARNNGIGISMDSHLHGGTLIAIIENTRMENNGTGIVVSGFFAIVTARGCIASGNAGDGFFSVSGAVLNIESSVSSSNYRDGMFAADEGVVRVSNSTITDNRRFGFYNQTGNIESRGNNTVRGNNGGGVQTDGGFTLFTAL